MAKIEDLIGEIEDSRLRTEIAAEIKRLKTQKNFGLVFEQHLPETVRLPNFPVREGELVAERGAAVDKLWFVEKIRARKAICRRPEGKGEAKSVEFPVESLDVTNG